MVSFCQDCKRRNDTAVSTTHLNTGGEEACCNCKPVHALPTNQVFPQSPPATPPKSPRLVHLREATSPTELFPSSPSPESTSERQGLYFIDTRSDSQESCRRVARILARSTTSKRLAQRRRAIKQKARSIKDHSESFLCRQYAIIVEARRSIARHETEVAAALSSYDLEEVELISEADTLLSYLSHEHESDSTDSA